MYKIYLYGKDSNNHVAELFPNLQGVDEKIKNYRSEGFIVRVYEQSFNDAGDFVERLIDI